ncbi:MAG: Asp-tRNA(Asn)/Glu-tRNA(Gln) amidotransferase subunit GatC [Desulfobulbaceae bacterium]|nr:Asp-tRNA(Asn)/Glu-tRNA(Gln) amidotransferase subunit GatC [Desulfobulbaceae bacterium]
MKITKEEVAQVARLARLELRPEEVARITSQLDAILGYVAKLDELDTQGVATTTHSRDIANAFRDDEVSQSLDHDRALTNAPLQKGEYFVVPRIIT